MFKYTLSFALLLVLVAPNVHQTLSDPRNIQNSQTTPVTQLDRLPLPSNAVTPEATAFDSRGGGPYTGVTNGRILKWVGPPTGFVDFAVTSGNWSKTLCESANITLEPVCGSALGIEFYKKTNTLYIADAYNHLRSVGPEGGVATLLASSADGIPFMFVNAVDIDQDTGVVYFIDSSSQFQKKDIQQIIMNRDMTGRLMKYDPATKQVTVLLHGLGLPAGTAVSKDGSFVLVSEYINSRIKRYWLKGPKANTSDIFYISQGSPDNIKRNADGDFWVAVSIGDLQTAIPLGILLDKNGRVVRALNFTTANINVPISNVEEYKGKLYIGSLSLGYIGVTRSTRG